MEVAQAFIMKKTACISLGILCCNFEVPATVIKSLLPTHISPSLPSLFGSIPQHQILLLNFFEQLTIFGSHYIFTSTTDFQDRKGPQATGLAEVLGIGALRRTQNTATILPSMHT